MTRSTRVEVLAPRRPLDDLVADESLPADLTVQVGSAGAPIADSVPLQEFVASAANLSHAQRMTIVQQALLLLEGNYVHLPLKAAMHAVNPVQRLRLLRARLGQQTDATMAPEWDFHREMSSIFHSVRDLHTNYLLPAPFNGMIAYLPFQVERCVDGGAEKYIVSHMAQGVSAPPFTRGVESPIGTVCRSPWPWPSAATGSPAATGPPAWRAVSTR
jgi:hypothetical protein